LTQEDNVTLFDQIEIRFFLQRVALMLYWMKPLGCDPARIKGMSERLIISHYENNYGGAEAPEQHRGPIGGLDYGSAPTS
jgi:hypothetical protein